MAVSEQPFIISLVSKTTLSTAYLYRLAYLDTGGYVFSGEPGTTGPRIIPIGSIYGVTKSTSTKSEAIPVAVGGVMKVKLSTDSTLSAGEFIAGSSKGYGCKPNNAGYATIGRILEVGATGDNPIAKVLWGVPCPASTADLYQGFMSSNNS